MDEATSALDVDARLVIEQLAIDLVATGLTVVWVTHDLEQAERLADRTVVLLAGRVVPEADAARTSWPLVRPRRVRRSSRVIVRPRGPSPRVATRRSTAPVAGAGDERDEED